MSIKEKGVIRQQTWKKLAETGLSSSPFYSIPPFKGKKQVVEFLRSMEAFVKA